MSMRSAPPGAAHGSSAFSHLEHKSSLQHMHTIRPTWSRMGSDFTHIYIYLAPPFGLKLKPFPKRILLDPRAEN